ncbi:methyl-accepting chemotaxis protein [Chloroflexota bacterium]
MKLRTKLFLGFGLIVLATVVLGLSALLTYNNVGQEYDLLQEDVVPGAISLLGTNVTIGNLIAEVDEIARSGDSSHQEHVDSAIAVIQANTVAHTEHETHIGDEEGAAAQDMEDRAATIVSLAEEVLAGVPVATSAGAAFEEALGQMYAEAEALDSIFDVHVAEHMAELADITVSMDDTGADVKQEFALLQEDIIPGAISMLETEATLRTLLAATEAYIRSGDTGHRATAAEAMTRIQANTTEHTAHERHVGDEEGRVAQDMEDRATSIINLAQSVIDGVESGTEQFRLNNNMSRIHTQAEELTIILETHVAEHMAELVVSEEAVDETQTTLQEEIALLQQDIVPGAISMLETEASLAGLLSDTEAYVRTGDSSHWENAEQAMARIQANTAAHTEHEIHVGEEEGIVAQAMENRGATVIDLAQQVKTAVDTYTSTQAALEDFSTQMHHASEELADIFTEHVAEHMAEMDQVGVNVGRSFQLGSMLVWVAIIVALILAVGVGLYISWWSILKPLSRIQQGSERIGGGDLDYRVQLDSQDELGNLATTFDTMADSLQDRIQAEQESRAYLETTMLEYMTFVEVVASGDLRHQLQLDHEQQGGDEAEDGLLQLGLNLNGMVESLGRMVQQILKAAAQITATTAEIQAATVQQTATAAEQNATVTQTVATVQEVHQTVQQTSDRAQSVADASQQSVTVSQDGQQAIVDTVDGMQMIQERVENIAQTILLLSERTQQISEITEAVSALADQSKLLALNASIEAARAGEEGRGFAVVAMEVRQLAEQSQEATTRISLILNDIQTATNTAVMATEEGSKGVAHGMDLVQRAGESIQLLASTIDSAAQTSAQIAASTQQQTNGMDQLSAAMAQISQSSTQAAASTYQTEQGVEGLLQMSNELEEAVSNYQL